MSDEDKWSDLTCTGEVDVSGFRDDAPRMEKCQNGEYVVQGTPSGKFRAVCTRCGKEYELT
jgi:hypothetical protein